MFIANINQGDISAMGYSGNVPGDSSGIQNTAEDVSITYSDANYTSLMFIKPASISLRLGNIDYGSNSMMLLYGTVSEDYDLDGTANLIDNDDDDDGILDSIDKCTLGNLFLSTVRTDHDVDGCQDSNEDLDDDDDSIDDSNDDCPKGTTSWTSNQSTDIDIDGCNDASEDFNDDNDNFQDFEDMCPRLVGNSTYTNEKGCPDDDGDGRANMTDPFPNDSS